VWSSSGCLWLWCHTLYAVLLIFPFLQTNMRWGHVFRQLFKKGNGIPISHASLPRNGLWTEGRHNHATVFVLHGQIPWYSPGQFHVGLSGDVLPFLLQSGFWRCHFYRCRFYSLPFLLLPFLPIAHFTVALFTGCLIYRFHFFRGRFYSGRFYHCCFYLLPNLYVLRARCGLPTLLIKAFNYWN